MGRTTQFPDKGTTLVRHSSYNYGPSELNKFYVEPSFSIVVRSVMSGCVRVASRGSKQGKIFRGVATTLNGFLFAGELDTNTTCFSSHGTCL